MSIDLNAINTQVSNHTALVSDWGRQVSDLYFSTTPKDVTVKTLDDNGVVQDTTLPNMAKIKNEAFQVYNFEKGGIDAPIFTKLSPSSLKVMAGLKVKVGAVVVTVTTDTTLTLADDLDTGVKVAGTDYYVYVLPNGTFKISANATLPTGVTSARKIGGFHYSLVAEDFASRGNITTADALAIAGINAYSFWDLKWRPVANPEGMVHILGRWYDIYLLNSNHIINGTSKAGATIAGGATTTGRAFPKVPLEFGGNGTTAYTTFTWYEACEVARSHGKRLISNEEFGAIAYGVTENASASGDDGTVKHNTAHVSKWGIEQATGVQWIWSSDINTRFDGTPSFAWREKTGDRGQIYSQTDTHVVAGLLGGHSGAAAYSGSRASYWSSALWSSAWGVGCRFASDHLRLV